MASIRHFFALVVLMMAGFAGSPVYAQQVLSFSTGYQFETSEDGTSGSTVRLSVPARATILNVNTTIRRTPGKGVGPLTTIPLRVEFKNPQGGNAAGTQFPSAGTVQIALPDFVNPAGTFRSQKGCNDTWKVNITTQSSSEHEVRIFGTVTFIVMMPGPVNLDMIGSSPLLKPGDERDRNITAHDGLSQNSDLIAGPGVFRIKAKWDNDLFHKFSGPQRMKVKLLKPNGSSANDDTGTPSNIAFTYRATQADANLSGRWKVRVRNRGNSPTENFDIENWPIFNSTFQAECSEGSSITAD